MAASGVARHLRNYASAGVLSAVVGLISFPILTRNLSVADYGIVGLITASITLFIAVGKLGMQHAVIRFFAQVKNGNIEFTISEMNSTVSAVFFTLACGSTCLWLASGWWVLPNVLQYQNISSLFTLASAIVFVRLLGSGIMNFLRAQQRSGDVAISQSLSRFLNLCMIVAILFAGELAPWKVITCLLIAETLGISYAALQYRSDFQFQLRDVSVKLAKVMLLYGFPLMVLESLGLVLRLSDRYLVESILGVKALGQYSASYNLTAYIDIIILAALWQAVKPAYMQMWESEGRRRTQYFLKTGFKLYAVLGIPFIAVFSMTSPHLLGFLAGEKYTEGTLIIPYVAFSFWLEGAMYFLAAGLYIHKNTKVLMIWSFIATVVNLALNILLIPHFGLLAAAVVTIVSFLIFMLGVTSIAFKHVAFPVPIRAITLVSVASVLVFFGLNPLNFGSDVINFLIKGFSGTGILLVVVYLVEPSVKSWLSEQVLSRRGQGG